VQLGDDMELDGLGKRLGTREGDREGCQLGGGGLGSSGQRHDEGLYSPDYWRTDLVHECLADEVVCRSRIDQHLGSYPSDVHVDFKRLKGSMLVAFGIKLTHACVGTCLPLGTRSGASSTCVGHVFATGRREKVTQGTFGGAVEPTQFGDWPRGGGGRDALGAG